MSLLTQLIILLFAANLQLSFSFTTIRNTMSPQTQRRSLSNCSTNEADNNNNNNSNLPAYTFGLLTDTQHAPIPDGHPYTGNARYYRHAMEAAAHAAQHFQDECVDCVVNLGDIIDGKCADVQRWGGEVDTIATNDAAAADAKISVGHDAIDNVLQSLSFYNGKILHTYGKAENTIYTGRYW